MLHEHLSQEYDQCPILAQVLPSVAPRSFLTASSDAVSGMSRSVYFAASTGPAAGKAEHGES